MYSALIHGGDYNPEQWLDRKDILEKDIQLLKKAKINCVTLGVFSWAKLEPEEGKFDFKWLEKIVDRLYAEGISTILATPSGARPKWLADKYPEVMRVNEQRKRRMYGGRHNHCYTSPIYKEKIKIINTQLAKRFAEHPGVILWHISNEFSGECHCPLCQKAFQRWLQEKYITIENLNKAWWTTFWSHTYQDFSQVESPSSMGEHELQGLDLEWKRFVTYQTGKFIDEEIKALREAGARQPTSCNLMYDFTDLDYSELSKHFDIVSWDSYPDRQGRTELEIAMDTGFEHDYMRCMKGKPFLLMESCPSATNWRRVGRLKVPGILTLESLQAIACGSDSVQYFQIRQSRGGWEKFHGAVIDHCGESDTRIFEEVTEIGDKLINISSVKGTKTRAEVAIIYDMQNRWGVEGSQGPRNAGMFYRETALKIYRALKNSGFNVDVIGMDKRLEQYKLVIAPMLYMFRDQIEVRLREFVNNGGTLVLSYWSGIVDESDLCYLGGTPHDMLDVCGIRSKEIDALYDEEYNTVVRTGDEVTGLKEKYICKNLCDLVKVSTADVLMTYGQDFYRGHPALTVNKYGRGKTYYICTDMEESFYKDFLRQVAKEAGVTPVLENIPNGVFVSSRSNEDVTFIFLQNYGEQECVIEVPDNGRILLGNKSNILYSMETKVFEVTIN